MALELKSLEPKPAPSQTCPQCKIADLDHTHPEATLCAARIVASAIRVGFGSLDSMKGKRL